MLKSDVCHTLSLLQVCAGKSKGKQQMRGGRTAPPQRPEIPTPDVDEANAEFVLFARNTMVSTGHELFEFGASFVCCSLAGCTLACLYMPAAEPKRMLSLASCRHVCPSPTPIGARCSAFPLQSMLQCVTVYVPLQHIKGMASTPGPSERKACWSVYLTGAPDAHRPSPLQSGPSNCLSQCMRMAASLSCRGVPWPSKAFSVPLHLHLQK